MAPALGAQNFNHWTTREVQDTADEMRKELTKLKEELIDGECLNKFATLIMLNNTHVKENED